MSDDNDELRDQYDFDYAKAKPNRFAAQMTDGGRMIYLEPDLSRRLGTSEDVIRLLRAAVSSVSPPETNPEVH